MNISNLFIIILFVFKYEHEQSFH